MFKRQNNFYFYFFRRIGNVVLSPELHYSAVYRFVKFETLLC